MPHIRSLNHGKNILPTSLAYKFKGTEPKADPIRHRSQSDTVFLGDGDVPGITLVDYGGKHITKSLDDHAHPEWLIYHVAQALMANRKIDPLPSHQYAALEYDEAGAVQEIDYEGKTMILVKDLIVETDFKDLNAYVKLTGTEFITGYREIVLKKRVEISDNIGRAIRRRPDLDHLAPTDGGAVTHLVLDAEYFDTVIEADYFNYDVSMSERIQSIEFSRGISSIETNALSVCTNLRKIRWHSDREKTVHSTALPDVVDTEGYVLKIDDDQIGWEENSIPASVKFIILEH